MQRDAVEMMKAAGMLPDDCCILDEKPQEKASSFSRLLACVHQDDIAGFIALLKEGVSPAEKGPDGFSIAELVRNENKTLFINCLDLLNLRHEQKEPASVCAVAPKVSVADCRRIISDKQKELIQCVEMYGCIGDDTTVVRIRQLTEELLACGWDVNSEFPTSWSTTYTICDCAVSMFDVPFADRLLQIGAKIIDYDCLYDLIKYGNNYNLDLVKILIAHGCVLDSSRSKDLDYQFNDIELLKFLLEGKILRKDDDWFNGCLSESMSHEAVGMLASRGWNQIGLLLHAARCGWEDLVSALIANGADVNARVLERETNTSPLQEAVSAGHIEVVKILLQNGADWSAVDAKWREEWLNRDGWCYPDVKQYLVEFMSKGLFRAIEEDDAATFERLINSGADVYVLNDRGENTLQVAQRVKNQRVEQMIRMICEAERRPMEVGIRPPVEREALARIKDILLYGKPGNEADCLSLIDSVDEKFETEDVTRKIYESAAKKNYAALIKRLIYLEKKALAPFVAVYYSSEALEYSDHSHGASLNLAAEMGNVEACKTLLDGMILRGRYIDEAMKRAIWRGQMQVLRYLWYHKASEGIDFDQKSKMISIAITHNQPEILNLLIDNGYEYVEPIRACYIHSGILRMLLSNDYVTLPMNESCAFVDVEGLERLPLCIAANEGDDECVRLLLDAGAKVELRGVMGRTALHYAAYRASARKVQDLIHAGAEVNVEDERGYTPLHLAALVGDEACTRLLLEAGANANAGTLDGFTALHFAANQGRADIAELLLRHGAERNPVNGLGISALSLAEKAGYDALVRLMA
ncbi:MAG: ankyrin repeat domain-containing protein [Akkermansia sp.]|nr:ankyrin repeat domain-containing protein [Akkermansia sp.]